MLHVMQVLQLLELKVLEMYNKGVVDLANNWSGGGRTRHLGVVQYFIWKWKGEGLLHIKDVPKDENIEAIFIDNHPGTTFKKHVQMYCGTNEYGKQCNALRVTFDCLVLKQGRVLVGINAPYKGVLWLSHGAMSHGTI